LAELVAVSGILQPLLPATQAVVAITAAGGPEVLEVCRHPVSMPRAGEILIAVEAAGVNRHDCNQRRRGRSADHSDIPGLEVAGTVAALGDGVDGWAVGDRVAALTEGGGYAEFAIARADCALPVPEGMTAVEAAAFPEALFTIWHNFFGLAELGLGETVLIHGGASGVGTVGIQLLTALGHPVFVTCGSSEKVTAALDLGAAAAFNYRRDDFAAGVLAATDGRGVDVVLDMSGGQHTAASLLALGRRGRVLHLSPGNGANFVAPLRTIMAKEARITGSLLRPLPAREKAVIAESLRKVAWPLITAGRVRPVVHAVLPLAAAARAHQLVEEGAHVGKIVLANGPTPAPPGPARAQAAWAEALKARNTAALERIVADDLIYVHSTGRADNRTAYLDFVRSGPDFLAVEMTGPVLTMSGDTAVITGRLRLVLRRGEGEPPAELDLLAIQVWRRIAGSWRLSAAQTTRSA
jgi:putative PIG3 family NAD(P)H quinone oxidoreductase